MARNLDPKCRQCRREGEKLFLKGEKCFTDKCLLASNRCTVTRVPERNQEVRACTDAFPAKEGNEKVLTEYQHQHREHEKVEIQEELRELRITMHIPN